MMDDPAQAVAWTYDNISKYGGDPERFYLAGHSSGAHMGAILISDPEYLKKWNKPRSIVTAFAGLAGPYDFKPEEDDLKDMFGPPEKYPQMQVPTFIDGRQPPMLLLQGADDKTVIERNLRQLEKAIHKKGGTVQTKMYKGIDHIEIVGALSWIWRDKAPVSEDMINFFERYK
jgi:acetyl esterase/lipase